MIVIQTRLISGVFGPRVRAVANTGRRVSVRFDTTAIDPHEAAARTLAIRLGRPEGLLTRVPYPTGGLWALE